MEVADDATDAAVMAAARTDPQRFGELFERHARAIHAFLARRAGRDAADDLLGEVFVVAFRARERYDERIPHARPWLYGIARNVLQSQGRAERHQADLLARIAPEPAVDACDAVDDRVDASTVAALIIDAMRALPDGEREALELLAWENLTPAEISVVLDIPAGTVRSRLHRARTALRLSLNARPPRLDRHRRDFALRVTAHEGDLA